MAMLRTIYTLYTFIYVHSLRRYLKNVLREDREVKLYLYKYRAMNERNMNALANRNIWYSLGSEFNDPFDCTVNIPINLMTGESLLKFIEAKTSAKTLLKLGMITEEKITSLARGYLYEAQRLVDEGKINEHPIAPVLELVMAALNRSYVSCFSKNATNHLLWSHYSKSHTGFCVRYKKDILIRDINPRLYDDVKYDDAAMDIFTALIDYNNVANKIIFRKSLCWKYEDEVRFIHNKFAMEEHERSISCIHSKDAIDCIILGLKFDMDRIEELKSIVEPDVLFKKIERSNNSYKLYVSPERL